MMVVPQMQPPTLSLAERDRRWARVRKLMRERGFEGLLVAGFRSREMYETYISDDYNEGCVIFPLEGDPVVITWAHLRVMRARWSAERGTTLWVNDYRVATSGAGVAEVMREKRLADGNLESSACGRKRQPKSMVPSQRIFGKNSRPPCPRRGGRTFPKSSVI
jgi:hypothetical protein